MTTDDNEDNCTGTKKRKLKLKHYAKNSVADIRTSCFLSAKFGSIMPSLQLHSKEKKMQWV